MSVLLRLKKKKKKKKKNIGASMADLEKNLSLIFFISYLLKTESNPLLATEPVLIFAFSQDCWTNFSGRGSVTPSMTFLF